MTAELISREAALVAPELFVPDVDRAAEFYVEKLGFELLRKEIHDGRATFAVVALGPAIVMLADEGHYGPMGGELGAPRGVAIDVRFLVEDVDAVHRRVVAAGVPVVMPIGDRYYGLRDFIVRDPHGFRLRFAAELRS